MKKTSAVIYQVLVGNIGIVYSGYRYEKAKSAYFDYYEMSRQGIGRVANEQVALTKDGETHMEYNANGWLKAKNT